MTEKLKKLYQEVILQHSRQAINFEKRTDALYQREAYNPLCGDKFQLYLDIEKGNITALGFHGMGCAISKASTSVMVQMLEGRHVGEAKRSCVQFLEMLDSPGKGEDWPDEMRAFQAVKDYPGRRKCASIAWEALLEFLTEKKEA